MYADEVFCILCLLLLAGKLLRVICPVFQKLYLPSSVIAGLLGLLFFTLCPNVLDPQIRATIGKVPKFLINVIFATLFLGVVTPSVKNILKTAFPQLCLGQLLAWGQYVIGLGLGGLLFAKYFGVPPAFGNLLEIGFQGGHGTVSGMSQSFADNNWAIGSDLGYTVATAGMIVGIIIGMILINWALKKGHVKNVRVFKERSILERRGVYDAQERPDAGRQTVFSDSIDSLAFHIAVVGISILAGYGMLKGLQQLEIIALPEAKKRLFSSFPLFPLCMIGGVILQFILQKFRIDNLIDHRQMQRISGAALDFLVVSAVATIKLSVVLDNWLPLLILIALGTLFSVGIVIFVAPKLFKDFWFERAIADFGQATGVTATGLMLLRTVDPDARTGAAASFGYKQLIHEPFMGGGLWTALALPLVFTLGWVPVFVFSLIMFAVWSIAALFVIRGNRK